MLKLKAFFKLQCQSALRATLLSLGLTTLVLAPAARAATNVVTSAGDDGGAGTLRAVVTAAGAGDTIIFTNTLSGQTILLTNGQITLTKNVTIDGSALASPVLINGNAASTIFYVNHDLSLAVTLNSLVITNGNGNDGFGGGINASGNQLTLNNCTLVNNTATMGGAVFMPSLAQPF